MLSFWEWLYQSYMCTKREVHHILYASAAAWLQLHSFSSVNIIQDATIPAGIMHLVYRHLGSWWEEMKFLIKLDIPQETSSLLDIFMSSSRIILLLVTVIPSWTILATHRSRLPHNVSCNSSLGFCNQAMHLACDFFGSGSVENISPWFEKYNSARCSQDCCIFWKPPL